MVHVLAASINSNIKEHEHETIAASLGRSRQLLVGGGGGYVSEHKTELASLGLFSNNNKSLKNTVFLLLEDYGWFFHFDYGKTNYKLPSLVYVVIRLHPLNSSPIPATQGL